VLLAVEAEPQLEDTALKLRELGQRVADGAPPQRVPGLDEWFDRGRIREQVAEFAVAVLADGLVERDGRLDRIEGLLDVLELEAGGLRQLLVRRLAAMLGLHGAPHTRELDPTLVEWAIVRDWFAIADGLGLRDGARALETGAMQRPDVPRLARGAAAGSGHLDTASQSCARLARQAAPRVDPDAGCSTTTTFGGRPDG
jgi:hypothetical protein